METPLSRKFDGRDMNGYTAYRREGYFEADRVDEANEKTQAFVKTYGEQRVWDLLTLAIARGDGERKTVILRADAHRWQKELREIEAGFRAARRSCVIGRRCRMEHARRAYRTHVTCPRNLEGFEAIMFRRKQYLLHPREGSRFPERIDFGYQKFFVDGETHELYVATHRPPDEREFPKDVYMLVDPVSRDTETAVALADCLGLG